MDLMHSEQLHDLFSSTNIIRVIKSRRVSWERNVARISERYIETFGGEPYGQETTCKTQAYMGG
jgi:hypothetical protein